VLLGSPKVASAAVSAIKDLIVVHAPHLPQLMWDAFNAAARRTVVKAAAFDSLDTAAPNGSNGSTGSAGAAGAPRPKVALKSLREMLKVYWEVLQLAATNGCARDTSADVAGLVAMYDTLITSSLHDGGSGGGGGSKRPSQLQLELLEEIKALAETFATHGPDSELLLWRRTLTTLLAHVPAPPAHTCESKYSWAATLLRDGKAAGVGGGVDGAAWTERHPSEHLTQAVLSVVVELYLNQVCGRVRCGCGRLVCLCLKVVCVWGGGGK
jgi:hypothetical protein